MATNGKPSAHGPVPPLIQATPPADLPPPQPLTLAEATAWHAATEQQVASYAKRVDYLNARGLAGTPQYDLLARAVLAASALRSSVKDLVDGLTPKPDPIPPGPAVLDPIRPPRARAVPDLTAKLFEAQERSALTEPDGRRR